MKLKLTPQELKAQAYKSYKRRKIENYSSTFHLCETIKAHSCPVGVKQIKWESVVNEMRAEIIALDAWNNAGKL